MSSILSGRVLRDWADAGEEGNEVREIREYLEHHGEGEEVHQPQRVARWTLDELLNEMEK